MQILDVMRLSQVQFQQILTGYNSLLMQRCAGTESTALQATTELVSKLNFVAHQYGDVVMQLDALKAIKTAMVILDTQRTQAHVEAATDNVLIQRANEALDKYIAAFTSNPQ